MPRQLDMATLENYGRQFAVWWIQGHQTGFPERDRGWLKQELYNLHFKDEWEHVVAAARGRLVGEDLDAFDTMLNQLKTDTPRSDKMFATELKDRLAVDPDGNHVPGAIGKVIVGSRVVGKRVNRAGSVRNAYWPVYAGEEEERATNSDVPEPLPEANSLFKDDEHLAPAEEG